MPERGRLFQPFSQADDSTSKKIRRHRLGAGYQQKILSDDGGDIIVESKPGKGSIFTVQLPMNALSEK
ncbi:MAG TPA: hypothetical protein DCQ37_02845 [Desulfobacteraceae bacterium]|nr:hypothetical protein [Desulfobacteraceae bacterium]